MMDEHKKQLAYLVTLIFFLSLLFIAPNLPAQQKCLKAEDVISLLKKKIGQKDIVKQVERYGVDFDLNRKTTVKLVRAGAGDVLLDAIEKHRCGELVITSPLPNTECGVNVKVSGRSKIFKDKHLWVLAHRKDLKDKWWPQVGEVSVASNGSWTTSARLGETQDVDFDFEIGAVWVDSLTNTRLNDYLNHAAQTGNWTPMKFPQGSPVAIVTVKKVRH